MKKLIAAVILIAAATGGYAWYAKANGAAATATTQPAATATVARGNIFQAVAATGKVTSNLDVDIKCKASGEIVTLPFDVSQPVKKGDLLVQLDPIDMQRSVKQAEVAIASSKAKLAQAKQNLTIAEANLVTARLRAEATLASAQTNAANDRTKANRRRDLFEQNLTSKEDYDTAEAQARTSEAQLATARAQVQELKAQEEGLEVRRQDVALAQADVDNDQIALDNANQRLIDTHVYAPMDGVVSALNVQKGYVAQSGTGGFSGGTTLMTISDLSHIFVLASVDESDIGQVKLDSPCLITADAFPGKRFRGKVVRIATKGVNTSNVVTFEVKIEVTGEEKSLLKPEMTTNVQIVAAQKDDILVVPSMAISRRGRGSVVATVVGDGGKQDERQVTVGITDGDNYEVVDGLKEGDTVVIHKEDAGSRWNGERRSSSMMGMGGGSRRSSGGGGR